MTTMQVQMSLTLADAASGPLRAFTGQMEALKSATNTVGARLEAIAAGISNVSRAASAASGVSTLGGSLSGLSSAMAAVRGEAAGAATAIGQVGQRASAAGVGTYALEQAMAALGGTMQGVVARLGEVAGMLAGIGTEARAAGAGVRAGMAGMEAGMVSANAQASGLMTTLKGLGQLYAGLKIEQGLKASAKDAIDYQATQTRMAAMGMSPGDRALMTGAANAASRAIPQFNRDETLSMAIDLRNATGSVSQALAMLQPFAVAAFNMRMATPAGKEFRESDMLLIAKALEQRNATLDPARMQSELSMFERIYTATQGRVDAQQILGNLQYAKGGLGQSMDIGFLPIFAALIEQVRNAGGNGGQIGTALTSLQQSILTGTGNGQAQKARAALGLLDPSKLVFNRQGNIDQQKSDLRMAGAEEFQRNPYEWVQSYLKPALIRAGIDLADDAAVNATLNRLFPNRNASNIAGMMINRGELLEKDAANITQAKAGKDARAVNVETAKANLEAFKAQLTNLAIVIGTTLLPMITTVTQAFVGMFQSLADFFEAHPVVATLATWAAGFAGVGLAVSGMAALFGVAFGPLVTLLTGPVAAAVSGFTGAMTGLWGFVSTMFPAFAAGATTLAATVGAAFMRMIPLVGALIIGWEFGGLIAHLNVGGKEIQEWAADLIEWVVNAFRKGWGFIGQIVSSIIPGAQAAEAKGRAGPPIVAAKSTGGATGSWTDAVVVDPREAARFVAQGQQAMLKRPGAGLFGGVTSPGPRTGGSRSTYNPEADLANNEFKQIESELKSQLASADSLYKQGLVAVEDYYTDRQAALEVAIGKEQDAILDRWNAFKAKGDQAGMNRAETQYKETQDKLTTGTAENEAGKKQALAALDKDALDLKRRLLQTEGERHAAEVLHAQQELEAGLQRLLLNKQITQEQADAMRQKAQAAVDAREYDKQIREAQQGYADRLSAIEIAEKNGTLSETAATDQKLALQKQEAAQLDELLAKQRALYVLAEGEGGKDVVAIDKQMRQNQAVLQQLPPDMVSILKSTQSGFSNFFASIMNGTKSVSGAFKAFGQSMFETINNLVAKRLGDALFDSLFGGMFGGAKAAGGGGFLGSLFGGLGGGIGSLFGAPSGGSFASQLASGIIPLAEGTDYVPRDMLALIHEGERVMPKADNAAYTSMMRSGGAFHSTTNIHVTGTIDRRTANQVARQSAVETQRGWRRNG